MHVVMYIDTLPNRNAPPCILLCESYRVGKKVMKRTLANLTDWPPELVEGFRVLLRGGTVAENLPESFDVVRAYPHGYGGRYWRRFCLTTMMQQQLKRRAFPSLRLRNVL